MDLKSPAADLNETLQTDNEAQLIQIKNQKWWNWRVLMNCKQNHKSYFNSLRS